MRYVLLYYLRHERIDLIQAYGTERIDNILSRPACAKHAARWLIRARVLDQFCYAKAYQPHPAKPAYLLTAAGRVYSLLQRSVSVRCGAVVIITHAPSH